MKTMTCKQLGGPCGFQFHEDSADDVIKAHNEHLKESVANGDVSHQSALDAMKGRWKKPVSGLAWYKSVKHNFAALSDD